MIRKMLTAVLFAGLAATMSCKDDGGDKPATNNTTPGPPEIKTDKGVDLDKKVIKLGTLNDESGPALVIGKPYAAGKRILAEQINAGGSGLLPDGWKIELVEKDIAYSKDKALPAYEEIKDDILMIATSFGTPATTAITARLEEDNMVAMPASLSSKMAESEFTPPVATAYFFEAMRALDWAIEDAGGADKVQMGVIYQNDDYGQDGIYGLEAAAEKLGVKIVSKQTVTAEQADVTAPVKALQDAKANYVLLTVLPTKTGPILGTAATLKFGPKWIGNTPAWADLFYANEKLPAALFANFYLVTGVPIWGEDSEGMKQFLAAYEKFGKETPKDWYVLLSYIQGVAAIEVARRALEAKDITRAGYLAALHQLSDYTAGGMVPALNWSKAPYIVSTKSRILQPDFENKTFKVVADWADPKSYEGGVGEGGATGGDAPAQGTTGGTAGPQ